MPLREAELARQREFDEPFFFLGTSERIVEEFIHETRRRGFDVVRGGRFWHLGRACDKGKATRKLIQLYRKAARTRLRTIGLGDSPNDLPMLAAVDTPVLLPGPEGSFAPEVLSCLPRVIRGSASGPAGWNHVILEILGSRQ